MLKLFSLFIILSLLLAPASSLAAATPSPSNLAEMASLLLSIQNILKSLLSQAQAQTADITTGLVGHWKFDEGSGTTAGDASGNNNGTFTNGPTWGIGKIGNAVQFDGTDDYVSALEFPGAEGSAITVSAWVKPSGITDNNAIVVKDRSGFLQWSLEMDGTSGNNSTNNLSFSVRNTTGTIAYAGSDGEVMADLSWHHVVGVYDGTTVNVYLDGVSVDSTPPTLTGAINAQAHRICIGTSGSTCQETNKFFGGIIDDVRIYNRALSPSDIQALYAYTGGGTTSPPPPPTDTIAPSAPTNLSASVISSTQINLSWTASTDNVGVTGYRIYQGGSQIGTTAGISYSDTGLSPSTSYTYTVAAYDAMGNISLQSTSTSTTTLASIPAPAPSPVGSWTPPIGIPRPAFGIEETAPAAPNPWLTATPGFYYVDQTHAAATDTSNPYGTPAKPRRTIPGTDGNPLLTGSVVEIHGAYSTNHTSPNDWHGQGTAGQPIFIRGASSSQKPLFTAPFDVVGSRYAIFENLEFSDADGNLSGGTTGSFGVTDKNGQRYDSDHIVLRNSDVHGNLAGGGTYIGGNAATSILSDIVFYNNKIHDNGDVNATTDQDVHGIGVGGNTYSIWIVDNEMYRNSGDGLQINGFGMANPGLLHHIYVGRNVSHNNKQTGLWTKTASDVIFSQNTVYGHRESNSSFGAGMGFQYAPERVWFLYNHSYDNECGICATSNSTTFGQNIYLVGNLIHNIHNPGGFVPTAGGWGDAGIMLVGGINRYVINNTIYDVDAGINTPNNSPLYMQNNVISNVTLAEGNHVYLQNPGTWELQNSLLYQNGSDARVQIGNQVYTLGQIQSAFGKGQNSSVANPQFINTLSGDFHLQSSSPAINTGLVASVYQTFQNLYGLSVAVDYDKVTRPQSTGWDIGAFEYGGAVTPPSIPIPGDLNADGTVNSLDWSIMSARWLTSDAVADINDDGVVNSLDFSILNGNFGRSS